MRGTSSFEVTKDIREILKFLSGCCSSCHSDYLKFFFCCSEKSTRRSASVPVWCVFVWFFFQYPVQTFFNFFLFLFSAIVVVAFCYFICMCVSIYYLLHTYLISYESTCTYVHALKRMYVCLYIHMYVYGARESETLRAKLLLSSLSVLNEYFKWT